MKKIAFAFVLLILMFSSSFAVWVIETVDSEGWVGSYTSLKLDSNDYPHISYFDSTNGALKYANFDGTTWQLQIVDPGSGHDVGEYTSLALDSNGNPHISYYDAYNKDLKYARFSEGSWQISTVDSEDYAGHYTSIALDSDDNPHISYQEWSHGNLKYAYFDGSAWQISIVDDGSGGGTGQWTSLALDQNNNPRISYYNEMDAKLRYASYETSTWQLSTVGPPLSGNYTSLALDDSNNPHIAFQGTLSENLYYASYDGMDWQIESLDEAHYCLYISLALDSSNYAHISYQTLPRDTLAYAHYTGTDWEYDVVEIGNSGFWTSIALDSDEFPHISYTDYGDHDLKYASYNPYTGVSLLSFTAQPQPNSAIKLVWQVAASDDTQIVGFNLYRADAAKARKKDWTRLNSSPIAPNERCQYVDSAVQAGQGYQYRLSALTSDGKEEMLGTAQGEAGITPAQFALTAVYPNPTSSLLTCRLTMPQAGSVSLGLYDISGRLVLSQRLDLPAGEQEAALAVGNLARGIYTVQVSSNGESATKRIVVMR